MTPADALRRAALAGRLDRFEVTWHAKARMEERNVTYADLAKVLTTATDAAATANGRFRLSGGVDLDGDALSLVVALVNGCIIVTVF